VADYGPITRDDRVLVTGAHGMLGRRLVPVLRERTPSVFSPGRNELDLLDRRQTFSYVEAQRPTVVVMLAARVGGIMANIAAPYAFLTDNLVINTNTFDAARQVGVRKIIFIGSSCIYPRESPQPMPESALLQGPVEPTNEGYALAKIAGIRQGQYLAKEHDTAVINLLPPNLYGPGDTFDLAKSHVTSAVVRRFVDAHEAGQPSVTLLGTGRARREFLHVDDAVAAIIWADQTLTDSSHINVGSGEDISIRDLAERIAHEVGYRGEIRFDPSKPDGMPQKLMDSARARALGFRPRVAINDGLRELIEQYRRHRTG
jgi:GDP-L-fucose synthase